MSISISPCPFLGELAIVCLRGFFFRFCVPLVILKLGLVFSNDDGNGKKCHLKVDKCAIVITLITMDYFAIIASCSHFKVCSKIGLHAVKLKALNQIFTVVYSSCHQIW